MENFKIEKDPLRPEQRSYEDNRERLREIATADILPTLPADPIEFLRLMDPNVNWQDYPWLSDLAISAMIESMKETLKRYNIPLEDPENTTKNSSSSKKLSSNNSIETMVRLMAKLFSIENFDPGKFISESNNYIISEINKGFNSVRDHDMINSQI